MLPSWLDCVKHLLQSWTGFQLAVVMQCGGSMTNEKANWFAEVIADYVTKMADDLCEADLIDWISTIFNDDFDLILEDGSDQWFASSILKCNQWYRKKDFATLNSFMCSLPSVSTISAAVNQSNIKNSDDDCDNYNDDGNCDDDSGDGGCGNHSENVNELSNNGIRLERRHRRMEVDDEGWTTITYR